MIERNSLGNDSVAKLESLGERSGRLARILMHHVFSMSICVNLRGVDLARCLAPRVGGQLGAR